MSQDIRKMVEVLPPMIPISEAKRITNLSRETLYALCDKGLIRTLELPSGRKLVSRADLELL